MKFFLKMIVNCSIKT
ncbi:hypothetical protein BpHYR1_001592 [Brachionus plicatilis]|uniref:Uncharacterized protein n=1 Tax=Brachionus plicatilis TaxID=10195 RepID=A0A3M7RMA4_BRAPC|nr:hypothetical protein BpHYR1_001592 [Brachionus plicatilis]